MKSTLVLLLTLVAATAQADRPNIVLIMADDLGYADVGFNGSTDIKTPQLDQLAKNGATFTSAYVAHPFCGPSRMGMMTGRYPHEFGAPFNLPGTGNGNEEYYRQGIDVNETLISTVLQSAGYYTGAIGKWHMGTEPQYHPNNRGFDDYYGFLGGGHRYFPEQYKAAYEKQLESGAKEIWDYITPLEHNGTEVDETEYITDALSREAVRFVKDAAKRDQPFFLYVAYNAPHTPLEAKESDIAEYSHIRDEKRRIYAAMVHAIDRGVGNLTNALKESGELKDTLVIFLSDNGGRTDQGGRNTPLKEGKGSAHEGGYRVPMLFHWPGSIQAGTRYDYPVSALDFYPTFAGLADAVIPAEKHLDGKDIWPHFQEGRDSRPGEMIYAVRHRDGYTDVGARQDQWKICRVYQQGWKLFNIDKDISETTDLSDSHPEILAKLVEKAEQKSRSHTQPKWFHDLTTRDKWNEAAMPHFDETFSLD